jgi:uncharacterized protein YxjI
VRYVIKENFWHLGEDSEITAEQGNAVYHVDGKVFSLHGTLIVTDTNLKEVARVQRKLMAFAPTYEVTSDGQEIAEIRKQLFTPFHDHFTIEIGDSDDLQMDGDFFAHEFTISRADQTVATITKQWISLTASYGVDIAPGENDPVILASVLALDLAEDAKRH